MAKTLIICPSRGRPARARQMLESFYKTMDDSDILLCLDWDDPLIKEYENINYNYLISEKPRTTTELINIAFKSNPFYSYYGLFNDDCIFQTNGWDRTFIKTIEEYGDGIAYGNDLLRNGDLPCHFIVSGNIVRSIGWLQLPALKHLYGDNVWKEIGTRIGALYYHPDIIIEHKHWMKDKSLLDDTYKRCNSKAMYAADEMAFRTWLNEQCSEDIDRIKPYLGRNEVYFCDCGKEAGYIKDGKAFCDDHYDWKGVTR